MPFLTTFMRPCLPILPSPGGYKNEGGRLELDILRVLGPLVIVLLRLPARLLGQRRRANFPDGLPVRHEPQEPRRFKPTVITVQLPGVTARESNVGDLGGRPDQAFSPA